jgi:hypothetical protein
MQFEVVNFETTYNTFLGRPTLTKFMAIAHYAYLVLKMSGLNRVISIKRDVKRAYDCDRESCETTDMLLASAELQELKKALTESPPPSQPDRAQGQDFKVAHPVEGQAQQDNSTLPG